MLSRLRLASLCAALLAAPWTYKAAPGDRLRYKLEYRSTSELNFAGLFKGQKESVGAPQKIRVHIKGELQLTYLVQAPDGPSTVAVEFVSPAVRLTSEGEELAEPAALLQRGLSRPAFAQVEPRGRIAGLRFDPATPPEAQLAARALLSLVQFVLPEGEQTPRQWTSAELEPNGEFTARYTQAGADEDGVKSVKKRKLAFAAEATAAGPHEIAVQKEIRPQGELLARFDAAKGRLVGLRGEETQEVLLNGKAVGRGKTKLKLELTDVEKVPAEELQKLQQRASDARAAPLVSLKTVEDKQSAEQAIEQNELKGATAEQLGLLMGGADAA